MNTRTSLAFILLVIAIGSGQLYADYSTRVWLDIKTENDIGKINSLTPSIRVQKAKLCSKAIEKIPSLDNVVALSLVGPHITDTDWERVAEMKNLVQLVLNGTKVDNDNLGNLTCTGSLRYLSLKNCSNMKHSKDEFFDFKELRYLDISCTDLLEDGTIADLSITAKLRELEIDQCEGLTDASLVGIGSLKKLQTISLGGNHGLFDLCPEMKTLPILYSIYLWSGTELKRGALTAIAACNNLRILSISGAAKLLDEDFAQLAELQSLEKLDLRRCKQLSCEGIEAVCKLLELRDLVIDSCPKIESGDFTFFSSLQKLRRLSLANCAKLTDSIVYELKLLKDLEYIDLLGCNAISKAALADLEKALPDADIHPCPREAPHPGE